MSLHTSLSSWKCHFTFLTELPYVIHMLKYKNENALWHEVLQILWLKRLISGVTWITIKCPEHNMMQKFSSSSCQKLRKTDVINRLPILFIKNLIY